MLVYRMLYRFAYSAGYTYLISYARSSLSSPIVLIGLSSFNHFAKSVDMAPKSAFKMENSLEQRKADAARVREKYPDRIPVIVERAEKSDVPKISKNKYLVPPYLTVGKLVYLVRKRIKLGKEQAMFVFVNNVLPLHSELISKVYEENKDEDGYLYMTYSGENTFGDDYELPLTM